MQEKIALDVRPSVSKLLTGSIDYAGLFPPSAVSMSEAVLNYATYRNSNYSWMLGRFVVTAGRLSEFAEVAGDFLSRDAEGWHIAAVAGESIAASFDAIREFNAHGTAAVCDVAEIKALSPEQIYSVAENMPTGITAYFECPVNDDLDQMIAAIGETGQRAKIRTGGITADAFPTSQAIVRFVQACTAANVPFKATAGLHHPIRCFRPLTYESDAPTGTMHGFLNLFLMTGFAREGYRAAVLEDLMEEEFEEVLSFDTSSAKWRDEYTLNLNQIERLRTYGIQSFGSCSFDEPVADLQALGIL